MPTRVGRVPGCPGIPKSMQELPVLGSVVRLLRSEGLMPRKWPAAGLFLISAGPCPVDADVFGLWKQAESHPHSSHSFGLAPAGWGLGGGALKLLSVAVVPCPLDERRGFQRVVQQAMGPEAASALCSFSLAGLGYGVAAG